MICNMRLLILSIATFLGSAAASAGGFQLSDHSARAMALGGTFIAASNDVSSLYANPSVLSFLAGTHLSVGTTIMMPDNRFTFADLPGTSWRTESQVIFPPNIALSHTFGSGIGIGVGASIPYTLKNDWNPEWPASGVTTHSEIRVVFVSPTLSVRLMEALSLGLSLNVAYARLVMSRMIGVDGTGEPDGSQSLDGSGEPSYGFAAGVLYRPNPAWSIGAAYRTRTVNSIENGNVTFQGIPANQLPNYPNSNFSTKLRTPEQIAGGISCSPLPWLSIGGEVQYAYWSALSSVDLNFSDSRIQANPTIEKSIPLRWKNSISARGGIEIILGVVSFRAGYAFEQTPVPDAYVRPSFPDANRDILSGGIGYAVSEDLHVDFACSFAHFKDRSVTTSQVVYLPTGETMNGVYASSLTMIGINMSYSWGN